MKLYRKIYGVYGMVEWSTLIPTKGGSLRVDFANGCISTRGIDPATFSTDNLAVQVAIESSPKFLSGRIKLVKSFEIGESEDAPPIDNHPQEKDGDSDGDNVYPDVKNSQQAKEILIGEPYNVSLAELGNKAVIQEKAGELGIVFPNWK